MAEYTRIIVIKIFPVDDVVQTSNISFVAVLVLFLLIANILEYKLLIVPVSELILRRVSKPTMSIVQGKEAGVPVVLYPPNTSPLFK